jgi:hypothetical protein
MYCKLGAKNSAHPPVCIMWTVVPAICNVVTSPHIQDLIFNWTYLRWYWRYVDNSMRPTLQILCQIQRTPSRLRYVNCGPGHIQCIYSPTYLGFNSQLNVSPSLLEICRKFNALYCKHGVKYSAHPPDFAMCTVVPAIYNIFTAPHIQAPIINWTSLRCYWRFVDNSMLLILQSWCQIQRTHFRLPYLNCCSGHIQYIYSSAHSGFNIQLNVSALLLETRRHFDAHYTANWVPNIAHMLQFTLCELWSRTCTM